MKIEVSLKALTANTAEAGVGKNIFQMMCSGRWVKQGKCRNKV